MARPFIIALLLAACGGSGSVSPAAKPLLGTILLLPNTIGYRAVAYDYEGGSWADTVIVATSENPKCLRLPPLNQPPNYRVGISAVPVDPTAVLCPNCSPGEAVSVVVDLIVSLNWQWSVGSAPTATSVC